MSKTNIKSAPAKAKPVLAAAPRTTNADLILDCVKLGYLKSSKLTLDPSYGRGVWWRKWQPDRLVTHDVTIDGVSFLRLPDEDNTYDVITYDPPYICPGGRATSGMKEFYARYGLMQVPKRPVELQLFIDYGMVELHRTLKPKGLMLVKCADYISSGKLWVGTYHTQMFALQGLNMTTIDRFEHVGHVRPQPSRKRKDGKPSVQQHARRNLSTLFVFQKAAQPRRAPSSADTNR